MKTYNWKNFTPIGNNMVVAFEQEAEIITAGGLTITQRHKPRNHFRILRLPSNFPFKLNVNDRIFCNNVPLSVLDAGCLSKSEGVYVIPYGHIAGYYDREGKGLRPLGKKVLLRRRIHTEFNPTNKIIIPAFIQSKDQTLEGNIINFGLLPDGQEWDDNLKENDLVHLSKWDMSHVEVSLPGGAYALIVDSKFLICKEEGRETLLEFDSPIRREDVIRITQN